jgi:hypothetical protein
MTSHFLKDDYPNSAQSSDDLTVSDRMAGVYQTTVRENIQSGPKRCLDTANKHGP